MSCALYRHVDRTCRCRIRERKLSFVSAHLPNYPTPTGDTLTVSKRVDSVVQPVLYSLRSTRLSDAALPPWKQTRSDVPRCLEKSSAHRACTAPGWCPASCRGRNSGSVNWSDEQIAAWKKARFLFRRIGAVDVVTCLIDWLPETITFPDASLSSSTVGRNLRSAQRQLFCDLLNDEC
ncbi:hypothetical protein BC827DRAFT_527494 [Russula dissimulans]|nr:hypothetical protein BC827DRAFT_527494 [Russula dissimulans]